MTAPDAIRRLAFACAVILGVVSSASAQLTLPPSLPDARLAVVFPAGGQQGTTFDVTVSGDDLDEATQLHFDDPGITSIVKLGPPGLGQTGPQPVRGVFTVTIQPGVKPGHYESRVIGRYGISNPRTFVVGTLPEITDAQINNSFKVATPLIVGSTVNGRCDGATLDYFKFAGKQGQRLIIDCEAFRIDSRLDGTLVLYDAAGRELERSRNKNRRDPMLDFTVPADGEYVISLYDHVYGYYTSPGECFYRLTISNTPYVDFVFPPAGVPGSQGAFTLFGRNLPGGQPAPGMFLNGKQLETLSVNIPLPAEKALELDRSLLVESSESFVDGLTYRVDSPHGASNPVMISMAGAPVIAEQEPNNDPAKATKLTLPCEYVGQFYPRGDRDWVTFDAKQGDVLGMEVFSQRLGLPTDPSLVVQQVTRDAAGAEQIIDLAGIDDEIGNGANVHWSFLGGILYSTTTHDPAYRFVAPATGSYRAMVRDLARSAPDSLRSVYRLSIRAPQPDFRLVAVPRPPTNAPLEGSQRTIWSPLLRRGGAELIEVLAYRRDGFNEEIRISADNLPAGVTAAPVVIAPGQNSCTLVLQAAEDAPAADSFITLTGKAHINQTELVRVARNGTMIWADQLTGITYSRSRLMHQLPVAVRDHEPAPYSLSVPENLVLETSRLGTVKFPVNVVRRGDFKGSLVLVTHGLPLVPGNPTHAQPKYHLPTELKADQNTTEFTITVPNYVPAGTYSFFISGTGNVSYARNPAALKAAQDRLAAVQKIVADDEAAAKAAGTATTAAEAQAKAKASAAFLQTFMQEVSKLQDLSKPTDTQISSPSNRLTLKITEAPVTFQIDTSKLKFKPGTKVDLPVSIKRLYGFVDPVQINVFPPAGFAGINIPVVILPKGQDQGILSFDTYPNAPTGTHLFKIQAQVLHTGQYLNLAQEIAVTIEKADVK